MAKLVRNKRFFICNDTLSTISVEVPASVVYGTPDYEVTMRDCSRQIHWLFPVTRKGLTKARKVAEFYNSLVEALEEKLNV